MLVYDKIIYEFNSVRIFIIFKKNAKNARIWVFVKGVTLFRNIFFLLLSPLLERPTEFSILSSSQRIFRGHSWYCLYFRQCPNHALTCIKLCKNQEQCGKCRRMWLRNGQSSVKISSIVVEYLSMLLLTPDVVSPSLMFSSIHILRWETYRVCET